MPNHDTVSGLSHHRLQHVVAVFYPCTYLLQDMVEELMLGSIRNASTRYEPGPLVEDIAILRLAGLYEVGTTSFTSTTPAYPGTTDMWASAVGPTGAPSEEARLIHDLRLATSGHGGTQLSVVTYQVKSGGAPIDIIRIYRRSTLKPTWFLQQDSVAQYSIRMRRFDALNLNAQWYLDILDVIQGISDRAVRHVAQRLQEQGLSDLTTTWKPARSMSYRDALHHVPSAVPTTELEADGQCMICTLEFNDDARLPLSLNHNPKHILCRSCLLNCCCHATDPQDLRCPYCRHRVFNDAAIEWLRVGVYDGQTYKHDARYDLWENAERSCADLDRLSANFNDTQVVVNSVVLVHAWDTFMLAAQLESVHSTPYHLQAVRSPDLPLLAGLVEESILALHGQTQDASELTDTLEASVQARLTQHPASFARSIRIVEALPDGSVAAWQSERPCDALMEFGLRPGNWAFVRQTLARMVEYACLRVCRCKSTEWHWHGLREYYNPDAKAFQLPKLVVELDQSDKTADVAINTDLDNPI